jgi:hypothetical protein
VAEGRRVFVVLDCDYGSRLAELAQAGPVWIVDTPPNRAAAEGCWAANPDRTHLNSVTTFKFEVGSSSEEILGNELGTIDLHHGIYSASPPYTAIEVIGATLSETVRRRLSEFGFSEFERTSEGFRAVRSAES